MTVERHGRRTGFLLAAVVLLAMWGLAPRALAAEEGIHKIQHVVMIMQENRSFDSYFGTYPGANGIPANVCVPDPLHGGCIKPFHDSELVNAGGPHGTGSAINDVDGGKMDGFVGVSEKGQECSSTNPACSPCNAAVTERVGSCNDVMGYHDAREIPNYWKYAENYVLQDNMFESVASWSLPEHLYNVSSWSAVCPHDDSNPLDCVNSLEPVHPGVGWNTPVVPGKATYAWTDLTYLMYKANVSWRYYVFEGDEPDCEVDEAVTCKPVMQNFKTPGIWNPLADFTDVNEDHQRGNIQPLPSLYKALGESPGCGLPNVSWVDPNLIVSEHPPSSIAKGQAYVTTLINAIMKSPCWGSTAIFLSWDDWGGFYDHVVPPSIDQNGYGLRVPGLVISPYAKAGYIDHQQLSHDAYLKFIEDDFLKSSRLNPKTDGRPDKRPDVREEAPGLGNLESDFNFNQAPRPATILAPYPPPGPASKPPGGVPDPPLLAELRAQSITPISAMLTASINPNEAEVSSCSFEYGTTRSLGLSRPCQPPPGGGSSAVAINATLEGLTPRTSYFIRVSAKNSGGTSYSAVRAFTTAPTATLPAIGRCERVSSSKGTSRYLTDTCTTVSSGEDTGHYEWQAGPLTSAVLKGGGVKAKIGGSGAARVSCNKLGYRSEVDGALTERVVITFEGCALAGSEKARCQTPGLAPGNVETYPLEGTIGRISVGGGKVLGINLRPSALTAPDVDSYECSGHGKGAAPAVNIVESGAVVAQLAPVQSMTHAFQVSLAEEAGRQVPEGIEGEPKNTLTDLMTPTGGSTVEAPASWSASAETLATEPLEARASP